MRHSPQRISPSSESGPCSSQSRSYSRTAWSPPPRSTRFEPTGDVEQLGERRRQRCAGRRAHGGCSRRQRDEARAAAAGSARGSDRASSRDCSRRHGMRALRFAVRDGLFAPHGQERMHDAVVAPRRHPGRAAARDEPVEDRLHLVGRGVPGRTEAFACDGVPLRRAGPPRRARARRARRRRPRAPRGRSAHPRRRLHLATCGSRAPLTRDSRARAARARGRSSRRRRRRDSRPRRPARSARAGGCALRSVRGARRGLSLTGTGGAAKRRSPAPRDRPERRAAACARRSRAARRSPCAGWRCRPWR